MSPEASCGGDQENITAAAVVHVTWRAAGASVWCSTKLPPCHPKSVTCCAHESLGWTVALATKWEGYPVGFGCLLLGCTPSCLEPIRQPLHGELHSCSEQGQSEEKLHNPFAYSFLGIAAVSEHSSPKLLLSLGSQLRMTMTWLPPD